LNQTSSVEGIINALSDLENNINSLHTNVEEIKRRLSTLYHKEIEEIRSQIINLANEEAKRIIDFARQSAENESSEIRKEGNTAIEALKKNINTFSPKAVDTIISMILEIQKETPVNKSKI
jgi:F0F1-type ATP synthase membrane subunit b/b'